MKNYIIFTADICQVGGMQAYVSSKVRYLKENNWQVNVFFSGVKKGNTPYKQLEEYVNDFFWILSYPPDCFSEKVVEKVLQQLIIKLRTYEDGNEVVIETQNDTYALWGELLADRLKGKNFCFNCNEIFRGQGKYYIENIEFFDFKLRRKELAGIHKKSIKMMFDGFRDFGSQEFPAFLAAIDDPVEDTYYDNLEEICSEGWRICYLGRLTKGYVPDVIDGIIRFARINKQKIQLILVGTGDEEKLIERLQAKPNNLEYCFLGEFVPLPKKLFEKVDVIIAGSGCALISARQGVPTIVADAKRKKAIGILGYNTEDFLYSNGELYSYEELLEEVLINRIGNDLEFTSDSFYNSDKVFAKHLELIKQSSEEIQYYKFEQRKKYSGLGIGARIKIFICNIFNYNISAKILRTIQYAKNVKHIRGEKNG